MFNLRLTARPTKAIKLNPNAAVLVELIPVFGREPFLVSALVSSAFPSSTTNLPSLVFSTPFTLPVNSGKASTTGTSS